MAVYTVAASADDAHAGSIVNDSGRTVTASGVGSITSTILSPGSHGGNDEYSAGCRFTGVAVAQGATIASATFSMKAQATYNAAPNTVSLLVSAQAADNPSGFTTATNQFTTTTRPRTTAVSAAWNVNSVTGGTRYSIDITAVIQEIVNRAGWVSGNAIVILIDTNTTTTSGEWQDFYAWDDTTDRTNNPPQLDITVSAGAASLVIPAPRVPLAILAR